MVGCLFTWKGNLVLKIFGSLQWIRDINRIPSPASLAKWIWGLTQCLVLQYEDVMLNVEGGNVGFGLHYWFAIPHTPIPSYPWIPFDLVNRLKMGVCLGIFSCLKTRIMLGASYCGMDGWMDGWRVVIKEAFWQSRFSRFLKALVQVLDILERKESWPSGGRHAEVHPLSHGDSYRPS